MTNNRMVELKFYEIKVNLLYGAKKLLALAQSYIDITSQTPDVDTEIAAARKLKICAKIS